MVQQESIAIVVRFISNNDNVLHLFGVAHAHFLKERKSLSRMNRQNDLFLSCHCHVI